MAKVESKILRIIDANLNRLKEGLRVCEDICRFILDDEFLARSYKDIRHKVSESLEGLLNAKKIIQTRDILKDVGKKSVKLEFKRKDFKDVFIANVQRSKESLRVIEEFNKLFDKNTAQQFKILRYKIYDLEKKTFEKIQALRHSG